MPRCEFGTPEKVTNDASQVLGKLTPNLRQIILTNGLHDVSALDPPEGFIESLVNDYMVRNEKDFIFLDPTWPELAVGAGLKFPPSSAIAAFLASSNTNIVWVNQAQPQMKADDVKQLTSRIMRTYSEAGEEKEAGFSGNAEGDDMDSRTGDTMGTAYEGMYGHVVVVSGLAQSSVCNSLHRQLSTGFHVDDLKSMISRDTPRRGKSKLEFDMESGKSKAMNSFSKGINTVSDFLARLKTFMNTLTFVSSLHVAPTDQWGGKPSVGVVRGTRYQFSRTGAEFYYEFWSRLAEKFKSDVPALVEFELRMRSTWVDKFGTERMSLESAMRESVLEKGHAADAWAPKRSREHEAGEEWVGKGRPRWGATKGAGGKGDGGGKGKGGGLDVSSMPGFRIGCKPYKGMYNGKNFCPHFNRGTTCWHGATCNKWHKCDTTKPDGQPCDGDHSRQQHPLD